MTFLLSLTARCFIHSKSMGLDCAETSLSRTLFAVMIRPRFILNQTTFFAAPALPKGESCPFVHRPLLLPLACSLGWAITEACRGPSFAHLFRNHPFFRRLRHATLAHAAGPFRCHGSGFVSLCPAFLDFRCCRTTPHAIAAFSLTKSAFFGVQRPSASSSPPPRLKLRVNARGTNL